jgi:hypothetical protein
MGGWEPPFSQKSWSSYRDDPMSDSDKSAEFRKQATILFKIAIVFYIALGVGFGWLGWRRDEWIGLILGRIVGLVVTAGGIMTAALMGAMSQDSA